MFKQIRSLPGEKDSKPMGSDVEIDEAYMGGKRKRGTGRPMRGDKTRIPIVGIVERGGKVVAEVIPAVTGSEITGLVRKHVAPNSTVYSDEYQNYAVIGRLTDANGKTLGYKHDTVKHSQDEFVRGEVQERRGFLEPNQEWNSGRLPPMFLSVFPDPLLTLKRYFPVGLSSFWSCQFPANENAVLRNPVSQKKRECFRVIRETVTVRLVIV